MPVGVVRAVTGSSFRGDAARSDSGSGGEWVGENDHRSRLLRWFLRGGLDQAEGRGVLRLRGVAAACTGEPCDRVQDPTTSRTRVCGSARRWGRYARNRSCPRGQSRQGCVAVGRGGLGWFRGRYPHQISGGSASESRSPVPRWKRCWCWTSRRARRVTVQADLRMIGGCARTGPPICSCLTTRGCGAAMRETVGLYLGKIVEQGPTEEGGPPANQ